MKKLKEYLKENNYIIVLAVVTIIVGILHFFINDTSSETWLKQSLSNLFITILGIWITVLCIDQIIKKKEQREKKRLLNIAYLEISRAINFYLWNLDRIYKVSSKGMPEFKETYHEMYNTDHFKEAFLNCDFNGIADYQNCSWGHYINWKTNEFISTIDNIVSKYSFILDTDSLSHLEMLKGATWVLVSSQMQNLEGKRDVIYIYYNEFLNHVILIGEIISRKSQNPRYLPKHEKIMWDDESFDKLGSSHFDH